jgi:hypothetical protein
VQPREELVAGRPRREPVDDPLDLERLVHQHGKAHVAVGELLDQHAEREHARAFGEAERAPAPGRRLLHELPVHAVGRVALPLELSRARAQPLERERARLPLKVDDLGRQHHPSRGR